MTDPSTTLMEGEVFCRPEAGRQLPPKGPGRDASGSLPPPSEMTWLENALTTDEAFHPGAVPREPAKLSCSVAKTMRAEWVLDREYRPRVAPFSGKGTPARQCKRQRKAGSTGFP